MFHLGDRKTKKAVALTGNSVYTEGRHRLVKMTDRRKIKRRYLIYYGRVFDETAQKLIGNLVDITDQGFMLLSDSPFPVNETHKFKLELTDDIAKRPFLIFTAKSLWCEPDLDPNHYNTGFEIVKLSPGDAELIQTIVKKYGFRDNEQK
jgi:hypothetical protein